MSRAERVVPAKAGTSGRAGAAVRILAEIPAYAEMTVWTAFLRDEVPACGVPAKYSFAGRPFAGTTH